MTTRRIFLILSGILFFLISPSSAVQTNNIKLSAEEVEIDAGSHLFIPCHYKMNKHFQMNDTQLEWDMVPEQGGHYKPVYLLYGKNKEPIIQPNERARGFLSKHKGDCSLAIDPTQIEDSGTYQVHLLMNGVRFSPFTDVKVHIKTCIESFGPDYCTCDEVQVKGKPGMDEQTMLIIAGSVSGGLLLLALIGCFIGVLYYCRSKEVNELKEIEEGATTEDSSTSGSHRLSSVTGS